MTDVEQASTQISVIHWITRGSHFTCSLHIRLSREAARQAGIVPGDKVQVDFDDESTLTIAAGGDDGNTLVKGNSNETYLFVPITHEPVGSVECDHEIDEMGRLVLSLPKMFKLIMSDGKAKKVA